MHWWRSAGTAQEGEELIFAQTDNLLILNNLTLPPLLLRKHKLRIER